MATSLDLPSVLYAFKLTMNYEMDKETFNKKIVEFCERLIDTGDITMEDASSALDAYNLLMPHRCFHCEIHFYTPPIRDDSYYNYCSEACMYCYYNKAKCTTCLTYESN